MTALSSLSIGNTYRFQISQHSAELRGLTRAVRVAHLSDLHYGVFVGLGSVRRWVDATLAAQPDLIVITGDFLDSSFRNRSYLSLLGELSRLRAPLGVYGVWGNHDWTSLNTGRTRARFAERLRLHGITMINNSGVQLRDDLYLAGVDDWWFGNQDLEAALQGYRGGAVLLLSHNPDFLPYVSDRVQLTLCGHTHGGQVRIPLVGPLKRPTLQPVLQGWVRGDTLLSSPDEGENAPHPDPYRPALGFVSRGLGVTGVPVRWACPAEIALLELLPDPSST
ncbi:hypothetical protein HNR42_000098 [Deinobacterium chartae]|uniref:Calcineurin-like phosphoesterase domain-containing protein n=1 Tax=Deinobacterium chartae TaxID=521158 RepID=A0A841HUT8_9DEIO|nr:metallophosphoesterase [Deinobacterium chartae]MBB6096686.1 hypothetical protein [Deinobacterium chartae]